MILYILLLLLTVVVSIAAVAYHQIMGKVQIPPAVQQLIPMRWGIVTGLNGLLLLFLLLQLVFGFPLESKAAGIAAANKKWEVAATTPTTERLEKLADRGIFLDQVKRTWALVLVFILHILAILAAALVFWVEKRGPSYPLPKIELAW
jgi:hypothetical protein